MMEFPRRYPRIGNAFQARWIPAAKSAAAAAPSSSGAQGALGAGSAGAESSSNVDTVVVSGAADAASAAAYASTRPKPVLFSTRHPFCTVQQVEASYGTFGQSV